MRQKWWMKKRSSDVPKKHSFLLDENIPYPLKTWLSQIKPNSTVRHANDVALHGKSDEDVFTWASKHKCTLITFDEDFTDKRLFNSKHFGIIRLKVWPPSTEEAQKALLRLFQAITDAEVTKSIIIIDSVKIRIRKINI